MLSDAQNSAVSSVLGTFLGVIIKSYMGVFDSKVRPFLSIITPLGGYTTFL